MMAVDRWSGIGKKVEAKTDGASTGGERRVLILLPYAEPADLPKWLIESRSTPAGKCLLDMLESGMVCCWTFLFDSLGGIKRHLSERPLLHALAEFKPHAILAVGSAARDVLYRIGWYGGQVCVPTPRGDSDPQDVLCVSVAYQLRQACNGRRANVYRLGTTVQSDYLPEPPHPRSFW